jgi:hypothetical protein
MPIHNITGDPVGITVAFGGSEQSEVLMRYELIPVFIILAIPILGGMALVVDAVRRAIQEADHDLHA